MKIRHNNSKKSHLGLIIAGVVALAIVGAFIYAFISGNSVFGWTPFPKAETSSDRNKPATDEQIKNGETIKQQSLTDGKTSGSDQPSAPVEQADGRSLVEVDIISINPVESSIKVNVMISSLDQDGSCTLSAINTSGTTVYTDTVGVQAQSNTSVCKGFTVPSNSLPNGTYDFKVAYSSGNTYGNAEQTYVSK